MNIYQQSFYWKIGILVFAAILVMASLYYNNQLAKKLSEEERKRVELIADVYAEINKANPNDDLSFELKIIQENETVPLVISDIDKKQIFESRNLPQEHHYLGKLSEKEKKDWECYQEEQFAEMKNLYPPITINLDKDRKQLLFYKDSNLLSQLKIYPFIQLGIIFVFLMITYFAFNSARRAEQNQVWVGMARETAHQIGTPLSSLSAWTDVLSEEDSEYVRSISADMQKDVARLELIANRFSKIGSKPRLEEKNLNKCLNKTFNYVKRRAPKKVAMSHNFEPQNTVIAPISAPLLDWVVENLLKNALDAMNGEGEIKIEVLENKKNAIVDVSDTGKGIPKSQFSDVFKPGFSSKKRGWGLGLSLSKRIIEQYHGGKIFVHKSGIGKGTTFRILLPKTS